MEDKGLSLQVVMSVLQGLGAARASADTFATHIKDAAQATGIALKACH